MNEGLLIAAVLAVALGIAHSVLGETTVLAPLFPRGGVPPLFGGVAHGRRTLRFA